MSKRSLCPDMKDNGDRDRYTSIFLPIFTGASNRVASDPIHTLFMFVLRVWIGEFEIICKSGCDVLFLLIIVSSPKRLEDILPSRDTEYHTSGPISRLY